MQGFTFPKTHRILNRVDFVNANREGEKYHTAHFTVFLRNNGLSHSRLGITTNKKVGGSVTRNRTRRLLRECYRLHEAHFPSGYDIVISAKTGAGDLDFWKVKEEILALFTDKKFRTFS